VGSALFRTSQVEEMECVEWIRDSCDDAEAPNQVIMMTERPRNADKADKTVRK
jgi:hypothetical protein